MKTILCSGQSNSMDHAIGGDFNISPRVTIWNNACEVLDATTYLGSSFGPVNRLQPPFISGGVSIFPRMASNIADALGEDVRIILVSHTGKSIDNWVGANCSNGVMLNRILAVLSAAGIAKVDGFAWHQGETAASDYQTKFENLIVLLKRAGVISKETPIVIGQLAAQYAAMNKTLWDISKLHPEIKMAKLRHLATFDSTHFTGPARVRAAYSYSKLFLEAFNG